jgi:hypothetical protein
LRRWQLRGLLPRPLHERLQFVPLVGARRRDRLTEALGALKVSLSAEDLAARERPSACGGGATHGSHGVRGMPRTEGQPRVVSRRSLRNSVVSQPAQQDVNDGERDATE